MEYIDASLVRIRFNTESDGKQLLWRLIVDGKEILVNSIRILVPSYTSTDWLEDKQTYKHHISVKNCRIIINDTLDAVIQ